MSRPHLGREGEFFLTKLLFPRRRSDPSLLRKKGGEQPFFHYLYKGGKKAVQRRILFLQIRKGKGPTSPEEEFCNRTHRKKIALQLLGGE